MLRRLPRPRSKSRLIQALLNDANAPAALLAADGRVLQAGAPFLALVGPAPALPGDLTDALRRNEPAACQTDLPTPAGACPVTLSLTPTGLDEPAAILRLTDLRPQRELESQLAQAQRLQSVGQLAAGIAHDFNNLLTAILSATEALDSGVTGPAREDLANIREAAERGAALVRQLLAFGRQQTLQPRIVALNDAVRAAAGLLHCLLGNRIELILDLEEPGRLIRIDPTQLDQVLLNLAANARDAMPDGGTLTLATFRRLLLTAEQDGGDLIPPGRYATIELRDTGQGIPPETLPHIFEPFFTTKRGAGGTGLGLSTVHGIVRQSGGFLSVASTPGQGTIFRITLPRHEGPPAAAAPRPARPSGTKLLLVEDEAPVRRLAARALACAGWDIIEAATPEEALAADLDGVAQLVSDVVMPGMDGPTLVSQIRQRFPSLPALLMSGYADAAQRRALEADNIAFLAKPFPMATLVELVGTPNKVPERPKQESASF
jgi:two-component system cell cycle sensor histidine kinase/response regulator CckA